VKVATKPKIKLEELLNGFPNSGATVIYVTRYVQEAMCDGK
jgi:hypothetical protein